MNVAIAKKRKRLSIDDRVNIIDRVNAGESSSLIAHHYGVTTSAVIKIKKNQENILRIRDILQENHGDTQKKMKITNIEDTAFEKAIYQWFIQARSLGEPVSQALLCEKAALFHQKIFSSQSTFKASHGWVHRFKKRHGIRSLTVQGERLSADSTSGEEFVGTFSTFLAENGYNLDHVYNADETGLVWKSLPTQTLAGEFEVSAPEGKVIKDRVTLMVCANASGSHKIPLFMIGKSKNPRCFKNVHNIPIVYRGQKNAWMDQKIFEEWYKVVFLPSIIEKHGADAKCLLILDNAPSHPSIKSLEDIDKNCQILYLPPNVTSLLQPMNQGVIVKLKRIYRKQMLRSLLIQDDQIDVVSFSKNFKLTDCCTFINNSWKSLTVTNLHRAWNNILNRTTGSADISVSLDDEEIRAMIRKIPDFKNYSTEKVHVWLQEDATYPGWRRWTDDEIIQNKEEEIPDYVDGEDPEDTQDITNDSVNEDVSAEKALSALKTLYSYVECSRYCTHEHISDLGSIRSVIEDNIYTKKIACFDSRRSGIQSKKCKSIRTVN